MDRLTGMAVFAAAVEEGSLAAASRRHKLSPSMAGKHIAAIEAELGVRLLQRSTRHLHLTEAGQAYYARCTRILEDYEAAKREAGETQETARGMLRVAAPLTFGAMHLGPVAARYMQLHPEVTLEILLSDRYADLLRDGIDVAIRIGRLPDSGLVARRLARCSMLFCASPDFLDRHGRAHDAEALRQMPRLAFKDAVSTGDWTILDPEGRSHNIDGPVRLVADNMQMLLAAAEAGLGVAYGPSFVFGERIAAGGLEQLLPAHRTFDLAVHAVYPSRRHLPLKLRSFVEHLVASFEEIRPWEIVPTLGD